MTHEWFDNELLTDPQEFSIATTELLAYSWDMTALMGEGESISASSVRVDRMSNKAIGTEVADVVDGTPSVVGNIVIASLDGSKLQQDKLYRVIVTVTLSPSKTISCMTMLRCVA